MNNRSIDFSDLNRLFPSEEQCLEYLDHLRWPKGYHCPRCGHDEIWVVSSHKYKCRRCVYQFTTTAGTMFHRTHLPMRKWFQAIWYIRQQDKPRATELQSLLEIGSNRTSQKLIHQLRSMFFCLSPDRLNISQNPLCGLVEIYKTFIRHNNNLYRLFVAVEAKHNTLGRIHIEEFSSDEARKWDMLNHASFVTESVAAGSPIVDNNTELYDLFKEYGYKIKSKPSPNAKRVSDEFKGWCKDKQERELSELVHNYCVMINCRKIKPTFDELLENCIRNEPAPPYESSISL